MNSAPSYPALRRVSRLIVLVLALGLGLPVATPTAQAQSDLPPAPVLLKDINTGFQPEGSGPRYMTVINGQLLFFAQDSVHGYSLWRSDGTEAGTEFVWSAGQQSGHGFYDAAVVGASMVFVIDDGVHGYELWRSDGTPAGTGLYADLNPGPASSGLRLFGKAALLCDRMIFVADDGVHGAELWTLPRNPPCDAEHVYLPQLGAAHFSL